MLTNLFQELQWWEETETGNSFLDNFFYFADLFNVNCFAFYHKVYTSLINILK